MNSSKPLRRIASSFLFDGRRIVERPLVTLSDDGCVVGVEQWREPDRMPGTEFYAGLLLPGMVNAHCHLELSYLRGAIPEGCGFAGFAAGMGRVRGRFAAQEREVAADAADAAMERAGIAAVGDVANDETAFGVKSRSRMRYHTFAEVFGLHTTDARGARGLLRHPATSLTPHSLYSLQDGVLRSLAAEGDGPLSIHFMESPAEGELFERRGALWEWYGRAGFTCDFLGYGSPAKRLVASVPPDRSVVLVHDCCVGQRDIDLIMEHFTAPVYWCLCPRSNRYISRLEPPVELLRRNGLNICLGTDSLASNDRLSVLEEMKLLSGVPLPELLGWATAGGASALGMDDMGRVAVGLRPGLSVITGIDYGRMTLTAASAIRRLA